MWDIDLFWHIAVGRLILEGGVPDRDLLSAADPEAPWRTFQWGYEALVAALDQALGLRAAQLLHTAVFGLFGAVAAALLRPLGAARGLLAFAALWVLVEDRVRERPHAFELLAVALCLPLVLGRLDAPRGLAAALLAGVWANLHAVSALWWLALFGARAVAEPRAFGWWGLGAAVMLASPPARQGLLGAARSHAAWPAELVPELRPTLAWLEAGPWGVLLVGLAALGLVAALARLRGPAPWPERLVGLGCAVAAVWMARWLPFAAVPLALALRDPWPAVPARVWGALALGLALALGARVLPRWSPAERLALLEPGRFPEAACGWMAAQGLAVPTDTTPSWTGYVLYRLHPGATTLSDGRMVFGTEVVDLLLRRGMGDVGTFDEAVQRFGTQALLWPTATRPPLDPTRWVRVYGDPVAEVWVPTRTSAP